MKMTIEVPDEVVKKLGKLADGFTISGPDGKVYDEREVVKLAIAEYIEEHYHGDD